MWRRTTANHTASCNVNVRAGVRINPVRVVNDDWVAHSDIDDSDISEVHRMNGPERTVLKRQIADQ